MDPKTYEENLQDLMVGISSCLRIARKLNLTHVGETSSMVSNAKAKLEIALDLVISGAHANGEKIKANKEIVSNDEKTDEEIEKEIDEKQEATNEEVADAKEEENIIN